ncbi:MAG: ATP-binding protein [Eubacteriales bacterium]
MRIIPKRTKVRMELFKGVEVMDVIVGGIGLLISASFLTANIPGHLYICLVLTVVTIMLVVPIEDDKGYLMIYQAVRHFGRLRVYHKQLNNEKKSGFGVEDITAFTGVEGNFIKYGADYVATVVEVPSLEFRFLDVHRQNSIIESSFGGILRTITRDQTIQMVKLDRPIVYDKYLEQEYAKVDALKEAFCNGVLEEEELTKRVGIIYDRMGQLQSYNSYDRVVVPNHYLVFIDKNQSSLNEQTSQAVSTLTQCGMLAHQLEEKELVCFLKYNYGLQFDEREVENLTPDQYMDWILPEKISFTARTVKYDELITHNFRFRDYPTEVGNSWGAQFFNSTGTKVVMSLTAIDRIKGIRQIDRSIDELREQGNATGKTSKIIELQNHIDTLADVLHMLQGENEILLSVNTYMTVYDYEQSLPAHLKGHMDSGASAKKRVRQQLSEGGFRVTDMFLQQFEAYASSSFSKYDAFKSYGRGIHSSSVAAAFPYVFKNLCDDSGVLVGSASGVPVILNLFQRDKDRINSNTVIIGKSGSGKSYATKGILSHLAAENSKIFILDPENEYSKLAQNMDGKVIDVGSATQGRLNPFHVITGLSDEESDEDTATTGLATHLQFLEEFYRQILPGIESGPLEYLNNLTTRMYEEKGIDEYTDLSSLTPEEFPIFDDLYDKILADYQTTSNEYGKINLTTLANYISKFSTGGRNSHLWNGPSSISTQENFIVFNFQSLLANKNNTIANAQMLLVLKWLDNEIIKNRDYNIKYKQERKIVVVIDEAHVFIDAKYPTALDFMYQLAKRIRKYNGMQIVITQNIKDFVGTEELARKSTAIINASQYSFILPLAPNDMGDLCKLYEKAGAINESEQYDIINNGRGRAFLVTSASDRTCIDIVVPKGIEDLFTM